MVEELTHEPAAGTNDTQEVEAEIETLRNEMIKEVEPKETMVG